MSGKADVDRSPILDTVFDSGTLHVVRADVKVLASRAGFPDHRVEDVVLAVHELAANAVHHGAGAGRLRIWNLAGALHCQVDDGLATETDSPSGTSDVGPWQATPGHGLWVVQQVADQLQVASGAQGTRATATFNLSPDRPNGVGLP